MSWLHAVLDLPAEVHESGVEFWSSALNWPLGPGWPRHPELRSFTPPSGSPYVHAQEVAGRPGVHLDVETRDPEALTASATSAGATLVRRTEEWTTLVTPGGLPFCVMVERDRRPPDPTTWPTGHQSRLVQLCIDSPADVHDREVSFWRGLMAGRWVDSEAREFAGKWHDDAGSPVQLLFQRLDEATGAVRAHLDLGTDDLRCERRRLAELGASDVGPGRGWHTFRDPAGLLFCVTENSPAQTARRDLG